MNTKTTILVLLSSATLIGCSCAPTSQPSSLSPSEASQPSSLSTSEASHATGLNTSEPHVEDSSHPTGLVTSEPDPTAIESSEPGLPEDSSFPTGLDTSEADPTGIESSEEESGEPLTYTLDQVASDTNANFIADDFAAACLEYDSRYKQWSNSVRYDDGEDNSEEKLSFYARKLAAYLPDYMLNNQVAAVYGDPEDPDYDDLFGTGIHYYAYVYQSPDKTVTAEVISYIYSWSYCADIYLF